jgi:hypothetical protein
MEAVFQGSFTVPVLFVMISSFSMCQYLHTVYYLHFLYEDVTRTMCLTDQLVYRMSFESLKDFTLDMCPRY